MRTVRLSWPAMAIVLLVLLACLGALVDAEPEREPEREPEPDADRMKPVVKLDPGALELIRRYEELCRIRKQMARLRYWKRDIREADPSKVFYPDIHGSSVEAVLWNLYFPDSKDTSFKLRPEGTYMW